MFGWLMNRLRPTETRASGGGYTAQVMAARESYIAGRGGVAPIFVGAWGAVDLIRDPFSDAQSGGLRITALATMDVTVARGAQLEVLTGLETAVE